MLYSRFIFSVPIVRVHAVSLLFPSTSNRPRTTTLSVKSYGKHESNIYLLTFIFEHGHLCNYTIN